MTAVAALDIALWDIEGKRLSVPVARLLGGPMRTRLCAYCSHWLGGADTEEKAAESAREAVRRGFSAFKWGAFRRGALRENEHRAIAHSAALMAAARQAVGPEVEILVECGEALSPRTARLAAQAFAPCRPGWFEEPIPFENAAEMARLQRDLPVPIATGERLLSRWEFLPLLCEGACQVIQPDLMHAGGITEVARIAARAGWADLRAGGYDCAAASGERAAAW